MNKTTTAYNMLEGAKILIEDYFDDFKHHLKNERILFSAPFGSGKTFFLEHFFKEFKSDYYTIRIFPVAYSVANNEDIFKLIRYDIVSHVLSDKNYHLNDQTIPTTWKIITSANNTIKDAWDSILKGIIRVSPPQFSHLTNIVEIAKKFSEKYASLDKSLNKNDSTDATEFGDSIKLYNQEHLIDHIIESGVKHLSSDRPVVLVIDDLDRIDPEHI